ncbi:MAG: hypothetical protein EA376_07680 [Phycisphaeraceae bacterium]|nr:MAG: hypothetical protein EA376_07680 [Phycisphaeraceae bacterium]
MTTPADAIAPAHEPVSSTTQPEPSLTIDPAPGRWRDLILNAWKNRNAERARTFRHELGLPIDRPIVMTGHQLEVWHPGVLAKFYACEAAARTADAATAWVMVDQDESSFWNLRAPVVDRDGVIRSETASLLSPGARPPVGAAVGACPAFPPESPAYSGAPALKTIKPASARLVESLQRRQSAGSAARQIGASVAELAAPLLAAAPTVYATDLAGATLFKELVERMRTAPREVAQAYNAAVRANPGAGVAELRIGDRDEQIELPLWRAPKCAPRRRVLCGELADIPRDELAPKALLLTLIFRLAGCELFIHGTGGAAYDAVTDAWSQSWLGETPAPRALVTATLRLPLPGADASADDLRIARWRAHHARHNPELLGLDALGARKRDLARRIDTLREQGEDASALFRDMHDLLETARREGERELKRLDESTRRAELALESAEAAKDRTWPFIWHEPDALRALRNRVHSTFDGHAS